MQNEEIHFVYGRSYLSREDAIALDPREMPLAEGVLRPPLGGMHNVIRDAAPDAWGRRVLLYRMGQQALSEFNYLLMAGPDRIGALDVLDTPEAYRPPEAPAVTLEQLVSAADYIERGQPLPQALHDTLIHGSSVGGARPKALLEDEQKKWIAKFSSSTDQYPVIRSELAAMWMAAQCGIRVPAVRLVESMGKDVLLIERFDRIKSESGWQRRFMISGLTALLLHETEARLASYLDMAGFIRRYGQNATGETKELYRRMVFNILIGNNDDHARNHAFFWDGRYYQLTPAYDICPMLRSGLTANQAMVVGAHGRLSTLKNAVSEAALFGLSADEARHINEELVDRIETLWKDAVAFAGLTRFQADQLRRATVLSEGCFY
jgi:serine/threonine-protein kinase HipA